MLTGTLSTTAYSCTTRLVGSNLDAATELDERTDAECPASTRNGAACWTVGGISGITAEPEAALAFQRTLAAAPVHAQRTAVRSDAPWPIDQPGSGRIAPQRSRIGPLCVAFLNAECGNTFE
ncbi:unnamed protein product [Phytophthora fragariaefolia]|uniref:Unnamed protein product n=1 Tax=Phytophthora fragariaefolia TaxID=1490495 RepID=A0A9W6XC43_9STRA|nr:unnamed protein product [Phytophthora fragariaefolia]